MLVFIQGHCALDVSREKLSDDDSEEYLKIHQYLKEQMRRRGLSVKEATPLPSPPSPPPSELEEWSGMPRRSPRKKYPREKAFAGLPRKRCQVIITDYSLPLIWCWG